MLNLEIKKTKTKYWSYRASIDSVTILATLLSTSKERTSAHTLGSPPPSLILFQQKESQLYVSH